jgi:hypothetical protein
LGVAAVAGDIVELIAYNTVNVGTVNLAVNTSTISGGTSGRIIYNNAATVGETATGTGVLSALGNAVNSASGLLQLSSSVVPAANMPNGSHILLNTLTASSSASLSDTTSFTSTYRYYEIIGELLITSTTSNFTILYQVGGVFLTATYGGFWSAVTGSNTCVASNPTGSVTVGQGGGTGVNGYNFRVILMNPSASTGVKVLQGIGQYLNNFGMVVNQWNTNTNAVTGLQFIPSVGNITSGTIKIYGFN